MNERLKRTFLAALTAVGAGSISSCDTKTKPEPTPIVQEFIPPMIPIETKILIPDPKVTAICRQLIGEGDPDLKLPKSPPVTLEITYYKPPYLPILTAAAPSLPPDRRLVLYTGVLNATADWVYIDTLTISKDGPDGQTIKQNMTEIPLVGPGVSLCIWYYSIERNDVNTLSDPPVTMPVIQGFRAGVTQ